MKKLFYAIGFFLIFLGIQCFFVQKFIFKFKNSELVDAASQTYEKIPCEFTPSPMAAWCLIFVGSAMVLYTLTAGGRK